MTGKKFTEILKLIDAAQQAAEAEAERLEAELSVLSAEQ